MKRETAQAIVAGIVRDLESPHGNLSKSLKQLWEEANADDKKIITEKWIEKLLLCSEPALFKTGVQ